MKRNILFFVAFIDFIMFFGLKGFGEQMVVDKSSVAVNLLGEDEKKITETEIERKFELIKDTSTKDKVDFKTKREMLENISNVADVKKRKEILKELSKEKDDLIKERAIIELSKIKDLDVMDDLINNLKGDAQSKGVASLEGLVNYSTHTKAQNAISNALKHKVENVRWKAVEVCGRARINKCVNGLVSIINKEKNSQITRSAIESLYKIRSVEAINSLKNMAISGKNEEVRKMCNNVVNLIKKEKK